VWLWNETVNGRTPSLCGQQGQDKDLKEKKGRKEGNKDIK